MNGQPNSLTSRRARKPCAGWRAKRSPRKSPSPPLRHSSGYDSRRNCLRLWTHGLNGRNPSLEAQAKNSISTGSMSMRETGTPIKVETIEERIRSTPGYVAKFNAALPGKPINIDTLVQAVAAFERTIEPGLAPFDRWVAGDEAAIPEPAKRGFTLFTGKAACFGCQQWLEIHRR